VIPSLIAPFDRGLVISPDIFSIVHPSSNATSLARSDLAWYHCSLLLLLLRPEIFLHFLAMQTSIRLRQQHQNHAVTAQEKLADEAVAVDRLALLAIRVARRLAPHFLDVL
jgi:hypothetical protein